MSQWFHVLPGASGSSQMIEMLLVPVGTLLHARWGEMLVLLHVNLSESLCPSVISLLVTVSVAMGLLLLMLFFVWLAANTKIILVARVSS
jgi:hypothetical protein